MLHTAAQPSHDWAASEPQTDFAVNANGTLNLLEAARTGTAPMRRSSSARPTRVYGDTAPTSCRSRTSSSRLELPAGHRYHGGIDTSMSIDRSTHSLFGVSKASADLLVQEYGRYFGMPTVCFRGGCLTGPNHAGAQLHGFLAYLMKCTVTGERYTVFGYDGKQVRDNIHSADLVAARRLPRPSPRAPTRRSTTSAAAARATARCSRRSRSASGSPAASSSAGRRLDDAARTGDHRWWISDLRPFQRDYPGWELRYGIEEILREIHAQNVDHWSVAA